MTRSTRQSKKDLTTKNMKRLFILASAAFVAASCASNEPQGIKDAFEGKFLIGTALNAWEITGADSAGVALVKKHVNSIVAENCMKNEEIHPEENVYNFELADKFVEFGEANGMFIIGHCLVWHSQLAKWFPYDENGEYVTPEVLKQRMKDHITTVVTRYKGRVNGWDVVNEAIIEDGSYRKSPFYDILGEEFIPWAFECAHAADPDAELYLNQLQERGLRIDAIGMQAHVGLDYPTIEEFEESLMAFAGTGINVMITEWDMSALPTVNMGANVSDWAEYREQLNPYKNGLPEDVSALWNSRMKEFMELFLKHSDVVTRVTAWGVSDGDSWKNNWPIPGRTDYCLLFDRNLEPKPFLNEYLSR